jgi:hypothetical protein
MKLLRFGPIGQERPGALDNQGRIRDLSSVVADIDGVAVGPAGLQALRQVDLNPCPSSTPACGMACPWARSASSSPSA